MHIEDSCKELWLEKQVIIHIAGTHPVAQRADSLSSG